MHCSELHLWREVTLRTMQKVARPVGEGALPLCRVDHAGLCARIKAAADRRPSIAADMMPPA